MREITAETVEHSLNIGGGAPMIAKRTSHLVFKSVNSENIYWQLKGHFILLAINTFKYIIFNNPLLIINKFQM